MLALAWGGNEYPWGSSTIVGLFAVSFLFAVAFVMAEFRAVEPLLPMHLFRLRTFALVTGIALTASVAFYSVISFLPLFLQVVNDVSATASGTLLTPLLLAFIVSSIAVGRIVTNTGHYRRYPIIGSAFLTLGLALLATLHEGSSLFQVSIYMGVCGLGAGTIMPLLVLAVQNEVSGPNLGVATSSVNFFRAIGGSLGVAITGAVFNAQLAAALTGPSLSPEEITNLPGAAHTEYVSAFADALTTAFAVTVPFVALAILFSFLLRDVPLRTEVHVQAEAL
jgi:predicted MFS family arabinose efflux permease